MKNSARGFSLIEILIAAAISLIIFAAGFITISGTMNARTLTTERIRATEDARLFYTLLEKDLTSAFPAYTLNSKDSILADAGVNNALEFFTRADTRSVTDEYVLVQYYVNSQKQLCRKVTSSAVHDFNGGLPPIEDNDLYAVCAGAERLKIQFRTWIPEAKDYSPPLSSTNDGDPVSATHIQVRLLLEKNKAFVKVIPISNAYKL